MPTAEVTTRRMGRKKNKPDTDQPPKPRPGYPVFARLDEELGAALERFLKAQRYRPTLTAFLERIIKEELQREGFWSEPPPGA